MANPRDGPVWSDRRAGRDRRGGRPRSLSEVALDWAQDQLFLGRDRPEIARDLGVDRRTLDRRLAFRRQEDRVLIGKAPPTHTYRCPRCYATVATPVCPICDEIINAFHALAAGLLIEGDLDDPDQRA